MAKNLIDKKYYSVIWIALVFATLIGNAYEIYLNFTSLESISRGVIILNVMRAIILDGALPAAICYVLALIMYSIGARSYATAIPRNDFIYTVMIFTAVVRLVCGIVEVFCILVPRMYVITSVNLTLIVRTVAYAVMFFFVFAKKYNLNPVEKYLAFRIWAMVYLVVLGIGTVLTNAIYLIVFEDQDLLQLINEVLADIAGYTLVKDSLQTVASAIALSVYAVFVLAAVVVGEIMRKEHDKFRSDAGAREEYFAAHPNAPYQKRNDMGDTYSDFSSDPYKSRFDENPYKSDLDENPYRSSGDDTDDKNDHKDDSNGKVFDEFDI